MPNLQFAPETQQPAKQASPNMIFEFLQRYQDTMALKGAIDLELFTHIGRAPIAARELAARCSANERAIRVLCDFLTVKGFLLKTGDSYGLTQDSALFLDRQSPAYVGSIGDFLTHPSRLRLFRDVAALVRNGYPLDGAGIAEPDNGIWVGFAKAMTPIVRTVAMAAAPIIAESGRSIKVLDIAAGSGMLGIQVALHNSHAQIVAADSPEVLQVAAANALRAGVQDRFQTIPGDVFESGLGSGYDLVIVSNFLHFFDVPRNVELLKKLRAAMNPTGRLAVVDMVPNEDRVSPPIPASFAMNMLAAAPTGEVYTHREFDAMFRAADFGQSILRPLEPTPMSLMVTQP